MPLSDAALLLLLAAAIVAVWAPRTPPRWVFALCGAALLAALAVLAQGGWQAWPGALAAVLLALPALLRKRRWTHWTLAALGSLSALLCALALILFPVFRLPEPGGPHPVGTQRFDLTDTARTGVLDDAPGTPRRIAVWAWYPAASGDGAVRPYFTGEERELAASAARNWFLPGFALGHLRRVRTHSHPDAPAAPGAWPVVVFNHGYWGWPGQNTALMEHLASRGYLVFSIGHPHDAATLCFGDGACIPTSAYRASAGAPTPGMRAFWNATSHETHYAAMRQYHEDFDRHRIRQSHDAWRGDIRFLVDAVERRHLPGMAAALAAAADLSRLAFAGMSFGGTTSASACHDDPRCSAAVNLDGEEFDWSLWNADARMPLLMAQSDFEAHPHFGPGTGTPHSTIMDYAYERWDAAGTHPGVRRVRVAGLRHLGFTDLALSARMPLRGIVYGELPGQAAVAAVDALVAGFLDLHLKGEAADFPQRQFQAHPALRRHDAGSVRRWWTLRPSVPETAP